MLGPVFGIFFGKAGIIYGVAGMALVMAGFMGARAGSHSRDAAWAGALTIVAPALAAGLPARWVAEAIFYNRFMNGWEQVKVSAFVLGLFMLLGALSGLLGRVLRGRPA